MEAVYAIGVRDYHRAYLQARSHGSNECNVFEVQSLCLAAGTLSSKQSMQ